MQTPDGEPRPPRANEPLAVEGVVFDLDETLVDSCEAIAHATNAIIVPLERLRAAGPTRWCRCATCPRRSTPGAGWVERRASPRSGRDPKEGSA
jgi:hypothetical protein